MLRNAPTRFVNMIPWIFVAIGIFFIWVGQHNKAENQAELTNRNNQTGLTNQFYNRATNCFAATTPTKRTPAYVKECYDKAEAATGIKGERYGDGL